MSKIKIINGKLILPNRIVNDGCVFISDGKIESAGNDNIDASNTQIIDAGGCYVAPGFIDLHTHGAGGYDFMDASLEAFLGAAETHAAHGTTALCPTTMASTNDDLQKTFSVYRAAKDENSRGATFLGLHLEGPYFSMEQRGAQDPRHIRNPVPEEYNKILSWSDDIIRWSAAPELEGSIAFGRTLSAKGILPAIAHSNAIFSEVEKAYKNGFTHVTHLYSGTSTVQRRNSYRFAGVIESAFLIDDMTVELIADGCHLPASLLRLVYKIKGADRIALITDSMRAVGMGDGETIIGNIQHGQKAIVEDGVAKTPDRQNFAGSVATTDRLLRTMVQIAEIPLLDAVKMLTSTPARIIGVSDKKGQLQKGYDADVVIFDKEINVNTVLIGGRPI